MRKTFLICPETIKPLLDSECSGTYRETGKIFWSPSNNLPSGRREKDKQTKNAAEKTLSTRVAPKMPTKLWERPIPFRWEERAAKGSFGKAAVFRPRGRI